MKVTQSCLPLCNPMDYTVHGILQARILEWVAIPFSRRSSQPRSPTLQVDSLPAEPQGKSKNTGVGSLSFLQGIFLIQESNRGLLHYRQILYQLCYHAGKPLRSYLTEKLNHIRRRKDKSWTWCKLSKSLSVIAGHERHIIWNIIYIWK